MDLFSALDIGASGMSAQRSLMNVISMNLANIKTTRTLDGTPGPYTRKSVSLQTEAVDSPFSKAMSSAMDRDMAGVKVAGVVNDNRPPPHGLRARPSRRQRRRLRGLSRHQRG